MNPLVVPIVSELVIPMIKKLISKPEKGYKEGALLAVIPLGYKIIESYLQCGNISCVDIELVSAFAGALWVLIVRLHQKHSEEIKNKNVLK